MSKELFKKLCDEIEGIVGSAEFKSEEYLDEILNPQCPDSDRNHQWTNIVFAHEHSTGGFISGHVKLAITLRILGGGSYLDLALLLESSFNHTHKIVWYVMQNWLCHESFPQLMVWAIVRTNSRCRQLHYNFLRPPEGLLMALVHWMDGL